MEGVAGIGLESDDMSVVQREILLLVVIFVAFVWFILTHIVSDLPDDFLSTLRERRRKQREDRRGGLRDNG